MLHSEAVDRDVSNPGIIGEGVEDMTVLVLGDLENLRGHSPGRATIQPRGGPERGFAAIPNSDPSCGVEELPVHVVTRGSKTDPKLLRGRPFLPQPTQAQGTGELIQIEDA